MRRREGDPGREHIPVLGALVGPRPVVGPPFLIRLRGVIGIDAHELIRQEQALGDPDAVAVERTQADARERRQQHREVEPLLTLGAIEGLIEDTVRFDLLNVSAGDPVDPALGEQRRVEDAAVAAT